MVAANFEQILRAFTKRKPFKAFVVELVSGDRIRVEHPEALVFRAGKAVYLDPAGDVSLFDNEGVVQLTDAVEGRKPRKPKSE